MPEKLIQGLDTDTDALADTLERMAEGLRSDGVVLFAADSDHEVHKDDISRFSLHLDYAVNKEFADVIDPIDYEVDGGPSDE